MPRIKFCLLCQTKILVKPSYFDKVFYCSKKCMAVDYKERMKGKNNPNFKNSGRKTCSKCQKEFISYSKKRKFCSVLCSNIFHRKNPAITTYKKHRPKRTKKIWVCRLCKEEVNRKNKYCKICKHNKGKIKLKCCICGKKFIKNKCEKSKKNYCSKRCYLNNLNNLKNPNWKGGITPINKQIRASIEYKLWRETVFKRDNFTCIWCGQCGGKLNADHIKPFAYYPESRLVVNNGRTLCVPCHKKTDTYLSNKKFENR